MLFQKKFVIFFAGILVVIIAVLIGIWVKIGEAGYESATSAMGNSVRQTVYGSKRVAAASAAANSVTNLDGLLSWQIEDSDVAKLNGEAGVDWINIDPITVGVLQTALDVAGKSGGAYDPTILPISSLWDFGGENQHLPGKDEIRKFLPYVNYSDLRVNASNSTASLKLHYMAIDLSGIEMGAACDAAAKAYGENGARAAIVAVGNSVGVYGKKPSGAPWQVAVRDPKTPNGQEAALGQVNMTSGFLSTAGVFESNFTENGVLYHSLLNPKTGYPENNNLRSVTVWAKSGALSDALAHACFILGEEKGEALLAQYGAGGIFVDTSDRITVTGGLKSEFTLANSSYHVQG